MLGGGDEAGSDDGKERDLNAELALGRDSVE